MVEYSAEESCDDEPGVLTWTGRGVQAVSTNALILQADIRTCDESLVRGVGEGTGMCC